MSEEKITVSVCILAYNHADYIEKCIDSFLMQKTTFKWELYVSDDCSSDDTVARVRKRYGDRIPVYTHDTNVGIPRNIYDGYRRARGEYACVFSGDDWVIREDYLQMQYDFLEREENQRYIATSCWIKMMNEAEEEIDAIHPDITSCSLEDYLFAKPTPVVMGLVRNVFQGDNLEWLYETNPSSDEPTYKYFLMKQGEFAILPIYGRAYRFVRNPNKKNYNSTHSILENMIAMQNALDNLTTMEGNEHLFYFFRLWSSFQVLRACWRRFYDKQMRVMFREYRKCISPKLFWRTVRFAPLLLIGKGNLPECYIRYHREKWLKRWNIKGE